ncbi:MAG: hypothetical protein JXK05_01985 [Campylobacterales bacterium]|nr:hypothetical protein [Campylobacterales bacterium]
MKTHLQSRILSIQTAIELIDVLLGGPAQEAIALLLKEKRDRFVSLETLLRCELASCR